MGLEQPVNYHLAAVNLMNRRTKRVMESNRKFIATGTPESRLDHILAWWINHALYVVDLLLGFIWPIVSYLLMTILMALAIAILNVIFFYGLIWLSFS